MNPLICRKIDHHLTYNVIIVRLNKKSLKPFNMLKDRPPPNI